MLTLARFAALVFLALPLMAADRPVAIAAPSNAIDSSAELDILFSRLKSAKSPAEAQFVQNMIMSIWATSRSDTTTLLYRRGVEAMAMGDNQLAFDLLSAVTALTPDFAEGWHELGAVNFALDAHDEALVDLERALSLEPRHFGALMGLASIFETYGNKRAALKALRQAYEINPHIEGLEKRIHSLARHVEGQGI